MKIHYLPKQTDGATACFAFSAGAALFQVYLTEDELREFQREAKRGLEDLIYCRRILERRGVVFTQQEKPAAQATDHESRITGAA